MLNTPKRKLSNVFFLFSSSSTSSLFDIHRPTEKERKSSDFIFHGFFFIIFSCYLLIDFLTIAYEDELFFLSFFEK
jgi:hypothetical protein